jgi:hypothetical protein
MTSLQLGFKETETRHTFRERLTTFRDGAIVEPLVRSCTRSSSIKAQASQVGYITSEIWREGETKFSLDHRVAEMHDGNGSTLCAPPHPAPHRTAR